MAYPTREALVAASSVEELTSATPERQDALRASAISAVEEHTGQRFEPWTGGLLHDASSGRTLRLKQRLVSLDVIEWGGSSRALSDVLIAESGDKLTLTGGGNGYYEQTMREISGEGRPRFPFGPDTVLITGTWGWLEVPDAVAEAIRMDMEEQALADANPLTSSVAAYRKLGIRGVAQGNLRVDLAESAGDGLSAAVRRKLAPYVWLGPGGELV